MKKIIQQGERIRRHLASIKAVGEQHEEEPEVEEVGCSEQPTAVIETVTDSGNVTDGSEASHGQEGEVEVGGAAGCVTLEGPSNRSTQMEANSKNHEVDGEEGAGLRSVIERVMGPEARTVDGEEPDCKDIHGLIEMLENLHRINKVLESKEEQILTMKFECDVLTNAPGREAPNPTFDLEVVQYREVNAAQLRRIADNSTVLRTIKEESEERRREVARLEFDVNLIERESKRLQNDLIKVESIGLQGVEERGGGEKERQQIPGSTVTSPVDQGSLMTRILPSALENGPAPVLACLPEDRASPPGSSRGSDKSVRFNDREDVLQFCSSSSSASLSPPPLLLPVLSPRSILKCVKGGYGSDSGSDTGVSSLSSTQGDYELSTLV